MQATLPLVAIVDDDPPVRKSLSRLLRGRGFEARTFGSAPEFLASMEGGQPDCLIVDLQMPLMTGLELLEKLAERKLSVPSIVITAFGNAQIAERCRAAGAVACLDKPLQPATLLAAIDTACGSGGERE